MDVKLKPLRAEAKLKPSSRTTNEKTIAVKTVAYGMMGLQSYEGVERIDKT